MRVQSVASNVCEGGGIDWNEGIASVDIDGGFLSIPGSGAGPDRGFEGRPPVRGLIVALLDSFESEVFTTC